MKQNLDQLSGLNLDKNSQYKQIKLEDEESKTAIATSTINLSLI